MELSLGFLVFLFLIIFPGLIYRRLYFYGEFSKQYRAGFDLINLIALSVIPGIFNLILIFYIYNNHIEEINIDNVINLFKSIEKTDFKLNESNSLNNLLNKSLINFMSFLYINVTIIGLLLGRVVRLSNLDTKFKLLRFKNYWFYLFNGQHTKFKKMKHLKSENKKHLFTNVDIQIESNGSNILYSGIIVDYELSDNSSNKLEKIILHKAKRYSQKDSKTNIVDIPGNIFIVDCQSMKNINFTYVYEKNDKPSTLNSKIPDYVYFINGLLIVLLIPISIFKIKYINFEIYSLYFSLKWYLRVLFFFLSTQIFSLLNPFTIREENYEFVSWKNLFAKIVWIIIIIISIWIFN